jgi:hypothetical protein
MVTLFHTDTVRYIDSATGCSKLSSLWLSSATGTTASVHQKWNELRYFKNVNTGDVMSK